jgi:hypothetical protein
VKIRETKAPLEDKTGQRRINFTLAVKQIVASRSAYECSFTGCSSLTIGPGRGADSVSNTGVAAHIYSAVPKGPRGQGKLSEFELSAASNAIWLCETHAKLIDNNRGNDFPPAVLTSYKGLHEASVMRKHTGLYAPLGWFHELRILRGPVFLTPTVVRSANSPYFRGKRPQAKPPCGSGFH